MNIALNREIHRIVTKVLNILASEEECDSKAGKNAFLQRNPPVVKIFSESDCQSPSFLPEKGKGRSMNNMMMIMMMLYFQKQNSSHGRHSSSSVLSDRAFELT